MNFALRIYRRLAEAFPHEFKLAYGTDVLQLGEDVIDRYCQTAGIAGLIRLIADIAIRVPMEYLSEMRRDMRYACAGADQVARIRAGRHSFHGHRHGPYDVRVQLALAVDISRAAGSGERRRAGDAGEACLVLLHRAISRSKEPVQRVSPRFRPASLSTSPSKAM